MSYSALPSPYGTPNPISANAGGALGSGAVVDAFTNASIAGILHDDSYYTMNITGTPAFPGAIGAAMALDPSVDTGARLAQAGDFILGRLETLENRVNNGGGQVGAVLIAGGLVLPLDPTAGATLPARGDSIQGGAVAGTVVKLARTEGSATIVVSVNLTAMTATVLFR